MRAMVLVRFEHPNGEFETLDIDSGASVMEGALHGGIEEILADCGGALSCATCHVYIGADWADRVAPPSEAETEMLEFAVDRQPNSRLSCQICVTEALQGLKIRLPERQQ